MSYLTGKFNKRIGLSKKQHKMKKYLYILIGVAFLGVSSCKPYKSISLASNMDIVPISLCSVNYIIIKDSVFCESIQNKHCKFDYLQITYHNKAVQDSLNNFFFAKQMESLEVSEDLDTTKFPKLHVLKNNIRKLCSSYNAPSFISVPIFDVVLNDRNVFTVGITNYDVNGRGLRLIYSFDITSGKVLYSQDVFNSDIQSLVSDLKERAHKELIEDYKYLIENIESHEEEEKSNHLKELIEQGKNTMEWREFIISENGIEFVIFLNDTFFNPYIYSFSFEELKPYLNMEFTLLINLI